MDIPMIMAEKAEESSVNSLRYLPGKCVNCDRCAEVCPHRVFERGDRKAKMAAPERCMECGACQVNCPTGAILVESGVGCASAMIRAALAGSKEVTCDSCRCGP